jgi:bifunctional non-homologous end joining protein LigD
LSHLRSLLPYSGPRPARPFRLCEVARDALLFSAGEEPAPVKVGLWRSRKLRNPYQPGQRSRAWQKLRVPQRRDFVIGGYTPAGRNFDAILIGDYEGRALKYVAKVHGGFTPAVRAVLFKQFHGLETKTCPFKNLPEARRGQWGEGLTAAEMEKCRWLKPRLVATIDYLERTAANHLRHPMFVGLTEEQPF